MTTDNGQQSAVEQTVDKILHGNIRATARLIRDVEDGIVSSRQFLKALYPHTGTAYVIGISGFPGVGKSTLVDQMIEAYRAEGKSLGVLAVDPTSPFSGGAILGDRVRMQRHGTDPGCFNLMLEMLIPSIVTVSPSDRGRNSIPASMASIETGKYEYNCCDLTRCSISGYGL